MNKSFEYVGGQIILTDETGKKYSQPACNNSYDIIRQENLIEEIDNQIKRTKQKYDNCLYDKKHAKNYKLISIFGIIFPPLFFYASISLIFCTTPEEMLEVSAFQNSLFKDLLLSHNITQLSFPSYLINTFTIICSFLMETLHAIPACLRTFKNGRKNLEHLAGYEETLKYLQEKKATEEEVLEELKKEARELSLEEQDMKYQEFSVDETYQEELNKGINSSYNEGVSNHKEMVLARRKNNKKRRQTHE